MRVSDRLLQQQRITLDTKPLIKAIRELRRALEHRPKAKLYAESLAARPTIAVGKMERGEDGVRVTLKPARDLAMFLRSVKPRRTALPNGD
jgi:hypothetical protein